jgi:hypothetical protein
VKGYPFTQPSKAALINNLSVLLEMKKVGLPEPKVCPELIDEMEASSSRSATPGTSARVPPSGQHDDCVIALALAVWQRRRSECVTYYSVFEFPLHAADRARAGPRLVAMESGALRARARSAGLALGASGRDPAEGFSSAALILRQRSHLQVSLPR